jgi:hypothetical protein
MFFVFCSSALNLLWQNYFPGENEFKHHYALIDEVSKGRKYWTKYLGNTIVSIKKFRPPDAKN